MADGFDLSDQRYLRGLPLSGPFAILIYRQNFTIFFKVPLMRPLCFLF
jgi:hypothetical protein